jgi:hypothetical protein
MSKAVSPVSDSAAVLTSATVLSASGRQTGVQGTGSLEARAMSIFTTAIEAKLKYLNESTIAACADGSPLSQRPYSRELLAVFGAKGGK